MYSARHRYHFFWLGALTVALLWSVPVPAQTELPDSETCLDCHEGYDRALLAGSHELGLKVPGDVAPIACVSCHSGGDVHVQDPSVDNIGNPGAGTGLAPEAVCGQCHLPHPEMSIGSLDPHAGLGLACADCHKVHVASSEPAVDVAAGMCAGCHVGVVREFQRRSNHPLNDGTVSCVSCHNFTGAGEPNLGHGGNANCYSCHSEQSGPYLYEHGAVSSFGPEGDGCVACHTPHGSSNDRLLAQPDSRLCRQCHGEPPAHRTAHSGIASGLACLDCHSEVHGSHDNGHLLDPQLGTKLGSGPGSCYCHNVSD